PPWPRFAKRLASGRPRRRPAIACAGRRRKPQGRKSVRIAARRPRRRNRADARADWPGWSARSSSLPSFRWYYGNRPEVFQKKKAGNSFTILHTNPKRQRGRPSLTLQVGIETAST